MQRCTPGGIGHALARDFHSQGLHVIATARDKAKITDLEALGMTTLSLRVDSTESILAAKKVVEDLTGGRLDILVNNA
jgi:1-acylglycerone phosphate reductase